MSRYIHELPDWPAFKWSHEKLAGPLAQLRHRQGRLIGRMESMGFKLRAEANLRSLTLEIIKSSEIEGQILDLDQVRLVAFYAKPSFGKDMPKSHSTTASV